jgi:hypothetical protein
MKSARGGDEIFVVKARRKFEQRVKKSLTLFFPTFTFVNKKGGDAPWQLRKPLRKPPRRRPRRPPRRSNSSLLRSSGAWMFRSTCFWSTPKSPYRFGPWLQKSQAPKHKETFLATAEGFFFYGLSVVRGQLSVGCKT